MPKITVFTMNFCPFCTRAKALLQKEGLPFTEVLVATDDEKLWAELEKKTGMKTMPQIFVGDHVVGGYTELVAAQKSGELKKLTT